MVIPDLASLWILDFIPNGCCILGNGGRILFWNQTLEAWTGKKTEAMVGASLFEVFPALGHPRFRDRILEVLRTGAPTVFSAALNPQFFPANRPGGNPRIQQTTLNRLRPGRDGEPLVLVTVADVTDQFERGEKYRLARAAALVEARFRQEGEEKHRVVGELSSDGILIGGMDGRILDCNPATSRLFGYEKEEILELSVLDLVPDHFEKTFQRIVTGELTPGDSQMAISCRRKDGTLFPGEINAKNYLSGSKWQFVMFVHDATERKRFEEALRLTQKHESLGVLAGGIAHDFNNLFSAVLGNLELGMAKLPAASPVQDYFRRIQQEILRASDLSRKMLDFSGKGRFAVAEVSLDALVQEMLPLLQATVPRRTALRFEGGAGSALLEADPDQLRQLLLTLVNNAAEAVGDHPGRIAVRTGLEDLDEARIRSEFTGQPLGPGRHVTLTVRDNGCGIAAENLGRIFDPFFTTRATGRGLSLAVALGTVRSHKGGITVASQLGAGSTFKLFFPALQVHPAAPSAVAVHPDPGPVVRTVLLVDDEPALRETTAELLEILGFQVFTACDGAEAVAFYRSHGPEIGLVLLDLTMPRMDGKEAFCALKDLNPAIKVIISSGYSEHDTTRSFQGQGPVGFLQKPYGLKDLEAILARTLPI